MRITIRVVMVEQVWWAEAWFIEKIGGFPTNKSLFRRLSEDTINSERKLDVRRKRISEFIVQGNRWLNHTGHGNGLTAGLTNTCVIQTDILLQSTYAKPNSLGDMTWFLPRFWCRRNSSAELFECEKWRTHYTDKPVWLYLQNPRYPNKELTANFREGEYRRPVPWARGQGDGNSSGNCLYQ